MRIALPTATEQELRRRKRGKWRLFLDGEFQGMCYYERYLGEGYNGAARAGELSYKIVMRTTSKSVHAVTQSRLGTYPILFIKA